MKENKNFISYIIPVYNAQNYLRRCVESILNGIGSEEEIILVEDGSTDNSRAICEELSKEYNCIKTIHQTNSGEACARNAGMDMASGEWIVFVDSDDYLAVDYHEMLIRELKTSFDIVMYAFQKDDELGQHGNSNSGLENKIFEKSQIKIDLAGKCFCGKADFTGSGRFSCRSVWAKAFKREFILKNYIRFHDHVFIGPDCEFMFECYLKASRIRYVDTPFYYYFYNMSSITHRYKPDMVENTVISRSVMEPLLKQFSEYIPHYETYLLNMLILHIRDDFYHKASPLRGAERRNHISEVIDRGKYAESYKIAVQTKKIQFYPIEKRIVFWAAVNKKYGMLFVLYKLRYGKR